MVLRGAQLQRFGPAGCILLTRRALSRIVPHPSMGQFDAVSLQQTKRDDARTAGDSKRRAVLGIYKGSRCMARAGDLCRGHIGESSSASQPWW